jgi:MFS family permease
MITSKIYNWLKKKDEDLAGGLAWGLVGGLAVGLAWGLVGGLAWGLVGGLAVGLAGGLAWGLAWGLVGGLAVGFISLFKYPLSIHYGWIILIWFLLMEFIYWLEPRKKVSKNQIMGKTILKKLESGFEAIALISLFNLIRIGIKNISRFPIDVVLDWIGYIGLGISGVGVLIFIGWVYFKLNALKYARLKGGRKDEN